MTNIQTLSSAPLRRPRRVYVHVLRFGERPELILVKAGRVDPTRSIARLNRIASVPSCPVPFQLLSKAFAAVPPTVSSAQAEETANDRLRSFMRDHRCHRLRGSVSWYRATETQAWAAARYALEPFGDATAILSKEAA